jgi:four helix bundle protein
MREYGFERLEVWKLSRELVGLIYSITADFPKSEMYGLTSQIRRSAISVPSNISEAAGRSGDKDRKKFYRYAYGSLMELLNQMIISVDLQYCTEKQLNENIRPLIEKISLSLYKLKGKV